MTTRKYRKANNFRKTRLKKGGEKKKSKSDGKYTKKSSPVKEEVSPVKEEEEVCAICLEKIEEKDNIPKLPCDHKFHKHCLMPLCKIKNNIKVECPLCRASITKSCKSDINPLPRRPRQRLMNMTMEEIRQRLMNMTMEERQEHVQRERRNYLARRRRAIARETPPQREERESRESREASEEAAARNRYYQGDSQLHRDQISRNILSRGLPLPESPPTRPYYPPGSPDYPPPPT